jgi:hypothetical protein
VTRVKPRTIKIDAAFIAGLVAAGAGLFYVSNKPVTESRVRAATLTSDLSTVNAEQASARERNASLEERVARLERAIADSAVPLRPADEINEQVAALTAAAEAAGLRLREVRPGRASEVVDHAERQISMSGAGTFNGLVALLDIFRERFPDVRVRSMMVTRQAGRSADVEPGDGPQTASFSLDMVWFADPAGG